MGKKGMIREAVTEYIDHARTAAQHHLHTSVVSILSKKKLSGSLTTRVLARLNTVRRRKHGASHGASTASIPRPFWQSY